MIVEVLSPWGQSEEASSRRSKAFVTLPWRVHHAILTKNMSGGFFKPDFTVPFCFSGVGTQTEGKCKYCENKSATDWR